MNQPEEATLEWDDSTPQVLLPLYSFVGFFLGSILQPKTLKDLVDSIGTGTSTDIDTILQAFTDSWQTFASYWVGFLFLAVLGALFVIVFTLTGCIVACCRCSGRCKYKDRKGRTRVSKCTQISCKVFLGIFTSFVLIGCIMTFLTASSFREETKAKDGAISHLQMSLTHLDEFLNETVMDTTSLILEDFQETKVSIFSLLDNVAPHTKDLIGNLTNSGPLLEMLLQLVDDLDTADYNLQVSDNATRFLQSQSPSFQSQLHQLRDAISDDVNLCTGVSTQCASIATQIPSLDIGPDYNNLQDLTPALFAVDYVINDNIAGQVLTGWEDFENISQAINHTWSTELNKVKAEVNKAEEDIIAFVDGLTGQVMAINLSSVPSLLNDTKEEVEKYGMYAFNVCMVLSSILLLTVVLVFSGLCGGALCKPPEEMSQRRCSTSVAANPLLAANGFAFIFAWVFMLITMVLFLGGGLVYTEVCRHALAPNKSSAVDTFDMVLSNTLNINFSLFSSISNCENDYPIYKALDIETLGFNISDILDINNYGLKEMVEEIKGIDIDIGTVTIITQDAIDTLNILETGLNSINFTHNYLILSENITTLDLDDLASELEQAAASLTNQPLADQLLQHASTSRSIRNSKYDQMKMNRDMLYDSLVVVDNIFKGKPVSQLVNGLLEAQSNINTNGNELIGKAVNSTADDIFSVVANVLSSMEYTIRHDLGKCLPLYESFSGMSQVVCKDMLNPINGFWISLGWSQVCLIPITIMCFVIADIYRCKNQNNSIEHSDVDDTTSTVELINMDRKQNAEINPMAS